MKTTLHIPDALPRRAESSAPNEEFHAANLSWELSRTICALPKGMTNPG